ncbi:MAG: tetratricopeptide repeat protein [Gammaproteobacteria bacterium]|nr:MAG: tetratricopeptide repeat protein [Gammaproteobacteria bacterium]
MSRLFTIVLVTTLSGLLLSGCGGIRKADSRAGRDDARRPEMPQLKAQQAPLPDIEFDSELLYQLLVGEISGQRGQLGLSVTSYLKAAEATRDPRIAARATRIAVFARDEQAALAASHLWAQVAPQNLDARQMLGTMQLRASDIDGAVEQFSTILKSPDIDKDKRFLLVAGLLAREKDKQAALTLMQRLIEPYKNDPHALYAYSYLAEQVGELGLARASIETLLRQDPDSERANLQYAQILKLQNNGNEAKAVIQKLLDKDPESMNVRLSYARLLVQLKQVKQARKQFEILASQAPDNIDILYALGMLALQSEDLDSARKYLVQLASKGKRTLEASFYLGQIAESQQKLDEARGWYEAVNRGENYVAAQVRAAMIMAKLGDVQAGRNHLRSIRARSQGQQVLLFLAESDMLREAKLTADALEQLTGALKELPGNVDLLYARSLIAEQLDAMEIAEADLRAILKQEPDNAHALNALGYTLADRTTRYKEAYGYIQRALELKPDDAAILDSMGWVLYRMGRHQEAIKYLKQALAKNDDGEIAAHLGEVLWVSGETIEAQKIWNQAIKAFPDHSVLQKAIKRFKP